MSTDLIFHPREHDSSLIDPVSAQTQPAEILLLSMPFGLPYMPSLGLSTLKAELAARGIASDIRYLGLNFAQLIGYPFYQRLAHGGSGSLGDWIFYRALYGPPSAAVTERFWQLSFADRSPRGMAPSFEALQERVAQAQVQACEFVEQCLHEIDWTPYRMVGFTTMFQQNLASLALAQRLKTAHPDINILFGGPNAEGDMGAGLMACFPFIDFVFSGESDYNFPAFAQALLADESAPPLTGAISREIPGGAVRQPSNWGEPVNDMDALPYPNFDDFFAQFNAAFPEFHPHLNYETARGCWWGAKSHCTFCGLNGMTMAFRSKSADRAIDEIRYLHQQYIEPHHVVLMQPADQILDLRYFDSMIPRLPEAAPGVPTFFETKANLSRDQVKALAEAHVHIVQPGIESLSSRVLKLMRKGCTLLQNVQLLKWCTEFGLYPIWNWLYGFPGEQASDYQQMAEAVPLVTHLQPPKKFFALELDRFSPYFTAPQEFGIENIRAPELLALLYPFDPQHQFDICYTFDFDYAEEREADSYLGASLERVSRLWMRSRQRGALVGFYDADRMLIWDCRLGAVDRWVELCGPYRDALLQADRILAETKLREFFAHAMGEAEADAARDDFLAQMEQRGLVLREQGRVLSLVVLHATADQLPDAPADQVVRISPNLTDTPSPPAATFGGAVIDDVLAGPPDDSDRYQVILQGSLVCTAPAHAEDASTDRVVSGVGVVESFWGVSAFRLTGNLQMRQGEPIRLHVTAARVSGFESGSWTLSFASDPHTFSGTAQYRDETNPSLPVRMEIDGLTLHEPSPDIRFNATGDGFRYANFLASGESLGGAELA